MTDMPDDLPSPDEFRKKMAAATDSASRCAQERQHHTDDEQLLADARR